MRDLLARMKSVVSTGHFEPNRISRRRAIAANDFQLDLLLPSLFDRLRRTAPNLRLQAAPSRLAPAELLRQDKCDLLTTPFPPDGSDILQKRLLADEIVCFFDPDCRDAPSDARSFAEAEPIGVDFGGTEKGRLGVILGSERGRLGVIADSRDLNLKVAVVVPNFAGIAPFLRDTRLIACLPSLMRLDQMRGFAWTPMQEPIDPVAFYVARHLGERDSAINRWAREYLLQVASALAPKIADRAPAN